MPRPASALACEPEALDGDEVLTRTPVQALILMLPPRPNDGCRRLRLAIAGRNKPASARRAKGRGPSGPEASFPWLLQVSCRSVDQSTACRSFSGLEGGPEG